MTGSTLYTNTFGNIAFRRRGSFSMELMYLQMQQRMINPDATTNSSEATFDMTTFLYGVLLVVISFLAFLTFSFWVLMKFFSHLLADTQNPIPNQFEIWIKNISQDFYYILLFPITIIVFQIFIYFNWLGMKYFKHN